MRLGGIYALQRIMQDSVRDHSTVVSVLAAYVRQHAPSPVKAHGRNRLRWQSPHRPLKSRLR